MAEEFTVENVQLVTQAIADHVLAMASLESGRRVAPGTPRQPVRMAVGFDTRFLSDHFAQRVSEVLAGNGIHVVLGQGPVPTCAVSRTVADQRMAAGIMITASHNPGLYNGLKVKEAYGGSAMVETVQSIERRLGRSQIKRLPLEDVLRSGRVVRADLMSPFLRGIRSFIDLKAIRRASLRVIADPMYGTAGRTIERLLAGGRCRVETIHATPDPWFGGQAPEPIASHLQPLRSAVRQHRADIGIATDGDADRLGIIAPNGVWLNPGQILCLLLRHLVTVRQAAGVVVKTVSNTMMINRMAEAFGLRLIEVPVGFKHITQLMLSQPVLIGGEESGGIGVQGYLPERDGILNGLFVLEAMAARGERLSQIMQELERRYGRWRYGRHDLPLTPPQVTRLFAHLHADPPRRIAGVAVIHVNRLDGVKLIRRDESWLLFRRSGTEPIVRIYAESPSPRHVPRLLDAGVHLATAT
jgi:phosphomannomutase